MKNALKRISIHSLAVILVSTTIPRTAPATPVGAERTSKPFGSISTESAKSGATALALATTGTAKATGPVFNSLSVRIGSGAVGTISKSQIIKTFPSGGSAVKSTETVTVLNHEIVSLGSQMIQANGLTVAAPFNEAGTFGASQYTDVRILGNLVTATKVDATTLSYCRFGDSATTTSPPIFTGLSVAGTPIDPAPNTTLTFTDQFVTHPDINNARFTGSVSLNGRTPSGDNVTTSGLQLDTIRVKGTLVGQALTGPTVTVTIDYTLGTAEAAVDCSIPSTSLPPPPGANTAEAFLSSLRAAVQEGNSGASVSVATFRPIRFPTLSSVDRSSVVLGAKTFSAGSVAHQFGSLGSEMAQANGLITSTPFTAASTLGGVQQTDLHILGDLVAASAVNTTAISYCRSGIPAASAASLPIFTGLSVMGASIAPTLNTTLPFNNQAITLPDINNAKFTGTVSLNRQTPSGDHVITSGLQLEAVHINGIVIGQSASTGNTVSATINFTLGGAQSAVDCSAPPLSPAPPAVNTAQVNDSSGSVRATEGNQLGAPGVFFASFATPSFPPGGSSTRSAATLSASTSAGTHPIVSLGSGLLQTSGNITGPAPSFTAGKAQRNDVHILGNLVTASAVDATVTSSCPPPGFATSIVSTPIFTGLSVAGASAGNPTPNTTTLFSDQAITLPDINDARFTGTVSLNSQISSGNHTTTSGLQLNPIHVHGIVIGRSTSTGNTVTIAIDFRLNFAQSAISCPAAPTAVEGLEYQAIKHPDQGVSIRWKTGSEIDNLGFNLLREDSAGRPQPITHGPLAGSALLAGIGTTLTAGNSYYWFDQNGTASSRYWLEELSTTGQRQLHGPISVQEALRSASLPGRGQQARLLNRLGAEQSAQFGRTEVVEPKATMNSPTPSSSNSRALLEKGTSLALSSSTDLAATTAAKIAVNREGWYRVAQPELLAAGLNERLDPRRLQLYVDGQPQPMFVNGEQDGKFDQGDFLEFYGLGLDTTVTDTHVYWVIVGTAFGQRIPRFNAAGDTPTTGRSFPFTVERKDRVVQFPALRNGADRDNFFGPVISTSPIDQTLRLQHIDLSSTEDATLEVVVQGITMMPHQVEIKLNGNKLQTLSFADQGQGKALIKVPHSILGEGDNVVTLQSLGGSTDYNLVDYVRLTYQHTYEADNDVLRLSALSGQTVQITGFQEAEVKLLDVTDAAVPQELVASVTPQSGGFALTAVILGSGERRLLAIGTNGAQRPLSVIANQSSQWRKDAPRADLLMIAPQSLMGSLGPLVKLRQQQGWKVALINIDDVYDEFSYGNRSLQAIKDILAVAQGTLAAGTKVVLLAGDASLDPRNYLGYLGFGDCDLIPTKFIDTAETETASDDWFADFDNDGVPELAIGRLPVRTVEECTRVVGKLLKYDQGSSGQGATLVSDYNDSFDFEGVNSQISALIPAGINVEMISRQELGSATRDRLLTALNQGPNMVNYAGHGSLMTWRGDVLTSDDAPLLTNTNRLTFYVMMACLNGDYTPIFPRGLGEELLLAPAAAVGVWASTGITSPNEQAVMDRELFQQLFSGQITIGEATRRAKQAITDLDVRRTWVLLGDPSMRINKK